jgi:membrane protease YdiL (CAAX protease family)
MKYFRTYPWGVQLLLFLLLVLTMTGFVTFMTGMLLPKFTPYSLLQMQGINEHSPRSLIDTFVVVQGLFNLFLFLIPAGLFAYLSTPRPAEYLGLRAPGQNMQYLLVILVMLGAMPVLQLIQNMIGHIDFGAKVKADQAANDAMMSAFLNMPDLASFVRAFICLAVIPAIGEEMFFRGVLMRFAKKRTRTMAIPIIFTAIVFAYSHSNIYGYLSIFLAGVLLAVIYNLTGSLWCSILGHFVFNGLQVIIVYLGSSNTAARSFAANDTLPYYYVVAGALVFCIAFYLLLKTRTPLPYNWANDFTREENKDNDWDFMNKK